MRAKLLRPSLLLEVAFMLTAWLVAWLVFDAKLYVIIIVIFAAYGLVVLYENWLDGRERHESRAELRRSKRGEAEQVRPDASWRSLPPPNAGVDEARRVEPAAPSTPPITDRSTVDRRDSEAELPREVIAANAREQAEREAREREAELRPPEPEPEKAERKEPEPVPETVPEADALATQAVPETDARPEPPRERGSLLAEYAAHPGEGRRTHRVGGWNIWQLERMMDARTTREEERDNERSLLLIYLREFADSDGQLPPEFDELVHESFGDLVRGPAGP